MIILSCGHREDDFDNHYSIMTKEWTRENRRAVGYKTVCYGCAKLYEVAGELLQTDEEALQWLTK
jgi:hypothetical protein